VFYLTLKQKPKWEPPPPTRIGKKKRRGPNVASKLPTVTPTTRCKLRLLKQLRIKDHLLMEEEVVALYQNRVKLKETEDGKKVGDRETDDETLLANLKGSPLGVGTLEEVVSRL
jgi:26S proteasome regulatory subunit T2